jgi:uncharacterized protein YjbI with pentapeptide repeats
MSRCVQPALWLFVFLSAIAACSIVSSRPAAAATYSFTNIMDSTVPSPNGNGYMNIGDASISGNRVAFKALEPGFISHESIFTSTGGPRTLVVETPSFAPSDDTSYGRPPTGGRFHTLGRPVIDGTVYFEARVFYQSFDVIPSFRYGDGIFLGEGLLLQNQTTPLIETLVSPRALPNFETYRIIADPLKSGGYLAYRKSSGENSALDTIQVQNREKNTTMVVSVGSPAPLGGAFSAIDANYDLSGPTVAFRGLAGSQEGIFTGNGGPLTTIVKKGDATPLGGTFNSVLDPTISGGTVAFLGTYAGGSGIFASDGAALSTIVRTGDTTPGGNAFTNFSIPTIAFNTVAFRGDYADGGGIYTKRGDELNKVVEIGDPLFGSTVASLTFSDLGLDAAGTGNLAFTYGLADGRTGVARANLGAGLPSIFQDFYGRIPVPDSVGINWVPVADFAGRNLTRAWLEGADLRSANGRNVNLTNAFLRGADLTNADLSGANLSGADFDSARLYEANLSGSQVKGAHFAREYTAVVDSAFGGLAFPPKAVGYGGIAQAQIASTASYQAHDLSGVSLAGNDLSNFNLAGQNLTGANFTLAKLTGADLAGAEIRKANFSRYAISATLEDNLYGPGTAFTSILGTGITLDQLYATQSYLARDLTGVNFGGNNLTGGNFAGHNLTSAVFNAATLTDADFTGAEVRGANFAGDLDAPPYGTGIALAQLYSTASYQARDLSKITLDHNDLTLGNFAGQNLTSASFRGAALTEADLSGAEVRGAIFSLDVRRFRYADAVFGGVIRGLIAYGTGITPAQLYTTASYQAHDLRGINADFNNFTGINLAGQNLSKARFYGASLVGANLSQANLTGAAFGAEDFPRIGPISTWPTSLDLLPADLTGANLSGANLTNANFSGIELRDEQGDDSVAGTDLTGANLSGADARGANFFLAKLTGANTANLIQSNGRLAGLDLFAGASLVVRDYDGNPSGGVAPPTGPLPITVEQHFAMGAGGMLQMQFEADAWDSTISFAAAIPVDVGGTLDLRFVHGANLASQIGRTFRLFNWSGVSPTGAFQVVSPYVWNLSKLYTTGEVTLAGVPEPSAIILAAMAGMCFVRRRPIPAPLPHRLARPVRQAF